MKKPMTVPRIMGQNDSRRSRSEGRTFKKPRSALIISMACFSSKLSIVSLSPNIPTATGRNSIPSSNC